MERLLLRSRPAAGGHVQNAGHAPVLRYQAGSGGGVSRSGRGAFRVRADSRIDRIDEIDHIDGMSWLTTEIDPGEHSQIECIRSRALVASGAPRRQGTCARE